MRTIRYREGYAEYQHFLQSEAGENRARMQAMLSGLQSAMKTQLTPKQRHYVELYYFQKINMPRIAELEGVGVPSVSRTLSRARDRLQHCFAFMPGLLEAARPE